MWKILTWDISKSLIGSNYRNSLSNVFLLSEFAIFKSQIFFWCISPLTWDILKSLIGSNIETPFPMCFYLQNLHFSKARFSFDVFSPDVTKHGNIKNKNFPLICYTFCAILDISSETDCKIYYTNTGHVWTYFDAFFTVFPNTAPEFEHFLQILCYFGHIVCCKRPSPGTF